MELVTPGIGQIFWTTIIFFILLVLLRALAWKPVLGMVKKRNQSIKEALESAEKAKEEMTALLADNEKILVEARKDRDKLIAEAKDLRDQIIKEAKAAAEMEGSKLIAKAKSSIQSEKTAAINDIKNQIAVLSVEIAEKLLRQKLAGKADQKDLIDNIMKDITFN